MIGKDDVKISADMPADLWRAAKVRAAERGETLRDLLVRAIGRDLKATEPKRGKR